MENKMLAIQSFYRNQTLIEALNELLVYLKLQYKGVDMRIKWEDVQKSKIVVAKFLKQLDELVNVFEKNKYQPLTGADERMRYFVKSFVLAKHNDSRFKSFLFKNNIPELAQLLLANNRGSEQKVIDSLGELSALLEEQTSLYLNDIIDEI
jgi:hypothetical protein